MAVAFDTASAVDGWQVSSVSVNHTASGANRLAVAVVTWRRNNLQNISTITYGGVAMTLVALSNGADRTPCAMYYYIAPATSSTAVAVTLTANSGGALNLSVTSYTGVHQTTPIGTPQTAFVDDTGTSISDTVTAATGDLCVDGLSRRYDTGAPTANSGQTERANFAAAGGTGANDTYTGVSTEPGAASVTMGWSWTSEPINIAELVVVPLLQATADAATWPGWVSSRGGWS